MHVELESEPQTELVDRLLRAFPSWFGIESSIVAYVEAARRLPALVARADNGTAIGVLLYERHFPESVEIHLMAVDPAWHRRGAGRALVRALEDVICADGTRVLSVKTLGPSRLDENYRRTRLFYEACGFAPVEEFLDLWPDNPCLLMVKSLCP